MKYKRGWVETGKRLPAHYEDIDPDGILLGKALGGGLLPISLFLAKNELMCVIQPGEHGSTLGGNPLAAFVAYEAVNLLQDENLSQNSAELGSYFLKELKKINHSAIKAVRGKGLMLAIELDNNIVTSRAVFEKLIRNGLLSIDTRNKVIRLLPPLIITKEQIDDAIKIIHHVFEHLN